MFGAALRPHLLDDLAVPKVVVDLRDGLSWPELKRSLVGPENDQVLTSKSEFFRQPLPANVVDELLAEGCELNFTPMGGAYNRVPSDATAFVHRGERFLLEHLHADSARVRRSWAIAHPHGSGRAYPNFPDPDLADRPDMYHGPNHARLVAIKRHYDPDRFFDFPGAVQ